MKETLSSSGFLILSLLFLPRLVLAQEPPSPPPAAYGSAVGVVELKCPSGLELVGTLKSIGRRWGLFPGLEIIPLQVGKNPAGALLLRGREEEIGLARQLVRALDEVFPESSRELRLAPVPLKYLSASRLKELLLTLAERAQVPLSADQVLVFPPGPGGGLFLLASSESSVSWPDIVKALDRPEQASPGDHLWRFLREFLTDLGQHFLTISTYLISALLLILLHFLLTMIPGLGNCYRRWFTLIWTRLLDGVKGRDFAYEILKNLAATAAAAGERGEKAPAGSGALSRRAQALSVGRDLLSYRGFNPDDPLVAAVFAHLLDAELASRERK